VGLISTQPNPKGITIMKRRKMSKRSSRKSFSKTAKKVHRKNGLGNPMRGGIRL